MREADTSERSVRTRDGAALGGGWGVRGGQSRPGAGHGDVTALMAVVVSCFAFMVSTLP